MPFINVKLTGDLDPPRRTALLRGLTDRVADLLGKRRDLTVAALQIIAPGDWSVAGAPLVGPVAACVTVTVTAGTNTVEEKAAFLAETERFLSQLLGSRAGPTYTVVHEARADAWGYDGLTQAARRPGPPVSDGDGDAASIGGAG